jgi:Ca2+-binding EF-hand superfamily protein
MERALHQVLRVMEFVPKDLDLFFANYDQNQDGRISFSDFC